MTYPTLPPNSRAMDRRSFLLGLPITLGAITANVEGQAVHRPLRIGILSAGGENADLQGPQPASPSAAALLDGLRNLGYRYGADFVLEGRGGQGSPERYSVLARELVSAKVDIIVAAGPTIDAVKRASSQIPIVMVGGATDPVDSKFVRSLSAPGGNITGLTLQQSDLVGKRLEILKELVPAAKPIAVLWEESSGGSWRASRTAAKDRGWTLLPYKIADRSAIGSAFASAKTAGAGSVLVISGGILFENVPLVVEAATTNRLPTMYALRIYPERGGLVSYAADLNELWRRAAAFIDRIAKGANPATMPIEQPIKFELVINLAAAKAIGLAIPQSILLRANDVIQ